MGGGSGGPSRPCRHCKSTNYFHFKKFIKKVLMRECFLDREPVGYALLPVHRITRNGSWGLEIHIVIGNIRSLVDALMRGSSVVSLDPQLQKLVYQNGPTCSKKIGNFFSSVYMKEIVKYRKKTAQGQ